MTDQKRLTLSGGGGGCGWSSQMATSRNWLDEDGKKAPAMSKTAVANLLRQIKGFVSSDVSVELNETDEQWGVGKGPIVKGWGQVSQKQQQQQQILPQPQAVKCNGTLPVNAANPTNLPDPGQTQRVQPQAVAAVQKATPPVWTNRAPPVACSRGSWAAAVRNGPVECSLGKSESPQTLETTIPKGTDAAPMASSQISVPLNQMTGSLRTIDSSDQSAAVVVADNGPPLLNGDSVTVVPMVKTTASSSEGDNSVSTPVSPWGSKFTPTTQCKPEALRRWTESPPPSSTTPPITATTKPNKMIYVSKWLNEQTAGYALPPSPLPVASIVPSSDSCAENKADSMKKRDPSVTETPTSNHLEGSTEETQLDCLERTKRNVDDVTPAVDALLSRIITVESKEQKLSLLVNVVQQALHAAQQQGMLRQAPQASENNGEQAVLIVVDDSLWEPAGIREWLSTCGLLEESPVDILTTKELQQGGVYPPNSVLVLINFDLPTSLEAYTERLKLLNEAGCMKTMFDPVTERESARMLSFQLRKCGLPVAQELVAQSL